MPIHSLFPIAPRFSSSTSPRKPSRVAASKAPRRMWRRLSCRPRKSQESDVTTTGRCETIWMPSHGRSMNSSGSRLVCACSRALIVSSCRAYAEKESCPAKYAPARTGLEDPRPPQRVLCRRRLRKSPTSLPISSATGTALQLSRLLSSARP